MSAHGSGKAVIFALAGNLLIAIIKFIVSFITGSAAMLAESIHSTADSFNQVLLLIGNKRSQKPGNEMHSMGYSREIFFWSLIVAVLLFFVGALFSIYEGISKTIHHEPLTEIKWIFIVLLVSIIIEAKSFQVAYKEFRIKHSGPLIKAIRQSNDVNLMVVLMEDSAALIGLIIVLLSSFLAWKFDPVFDAIGSILVGLLLLIISLFLIIELKGLIVGESIPREMRQKIRTVIQPFFHVKHINRLQTLVTGNNRFMVLLSVDLEDSMSVYHAEDLVEKMKLAITKEIPEIQIIYIEIRDAERNQKT